MTIYDKNIHVTAKELRSYNVQIPLTIPDHAFVPKDKVHYGVLESVTHHDVEKNAIVWNTPVTIDVDFENNTIGEEAL